MILRLDDDILSSPERVLPRWMTKPKQKENSTSEPKTEKPKKSKKSPTKRRRETNETPTEPLLQPPSIDFKALGPSSEPPFKKICTRNKALVLQQVFDSFGELVCPNTVFVNT